jgi:protein-disulfide isomerase
VASNIGGPLSALPARLFKDLSATFRAPLAATLALVWLAGSVGLLAWFPRGPAPNSAGNGTPVPEPVVPIETLDAAQVAEWAKWLDSQPQAAEAKPSGDVKVLVLKFNDYQCPACRQTYGLYKGIIEKYEAAYPGVFKFETRDYPLETECGFGGVHGAACEAAVAVRLAREKNKHKELEAAIFSRQSPSMTRDDVKAALEEVTQITDFDARYAETLTAVRADAQLGQRLGVDGTPTFFINGVKLGSLRPAYFDAAIAHALRKAGVQVAAS